MQMRDKAASPPSSWAPTASLWWTASSAEPTPPALPAQLPRAPRPLPTLLPARWAAEAPGPCEPLPPGPVRLDSRVSLRRGALMPRFGLGTWLAPCGGSCRDACVAALRMGYRLIDTAQAYGNESDVGDALRESGVARGEVFVVTKLQSWRHGGLEQVRAAVLESLRRLRLPFVDLVLIHSPKGGALVETYRALLSLRDEGLCRAVGVSNFGARQLAGLASAGLEAPEVNQIELHCWLQQRDTVDYCRRHRIAVMAYSPLARGCLFGRTALRSVAERRGCSEAQVAIRWAVQQGLVVIPKSVSPSRIAENAAALEGAGLSAEDQQEIGALDSYQFASCAGASSAMSIPWEWVAGRWIATSTHLVPPRPAP